MSKIKNVECKIKRKDRPLTEWERRKLSKAFRALFIGNNLDYLIITNNKR